MTKLMTIASPSRFIRKILPGINVSPSPELKLMLALAHLEMSGERQAETARLLSTRIDWTGFLNLCQWHGLFPLVARNLKNLSGMARENIPASVFDALQQSRRENALRMTGLCGELARLTRLIEQVGIRVLILKGTAAALRNFGDITLRKSCDIDLLVPPEDIVPAVAVLSKAGYDPVGDPDAFTPEQIKHIVRHQHHYAPLHHPGRRVSVELHWRISILMRDADFSFDTLWHEADRIHAGGHAFRGLSPEMAFLSMAMHGAVHGWVQLRWLCEIAAVLERKEPLDWSRIEKEAERLGMMDIILQTFILAGLFFGAPLPEWAGQGILRGGRALKLAKMAGVFMTTPPESARPFFFPEAGKNIGIFHFLYWSAKRYEATLRNGLAGRIAYVLAALRPVPECYQWVALPGYLHFFYYILRPVLWFRRRVIRGV